MKVLIAVTHLLGIGHLSRAAALGRALARAGHAVTLVSGGRPAPHLAMDGVELVQLPPLHIVGTDFRTLHDAEGKVASRPYLHSRSVALRAAIRHVRPAVIVVELFPFGRRQLLDEFLEMFEERAALGPETVVLSSVRDVLAPPSSIEKRVMAEEMLANYFDGVLVHGDSSVLPLEVSWPVSKGLNKVLRYTGYVTEAVAPAAGARERQDIIVSGGGSESSLPILQAACGAARRMPERRWRLLAGHGLPQPAFDALRADAPDNASVERARPDFRSLLSQAACSVSQAGYNTLLDVVQAGVPAVVVPFARGGEREQTIRAERFAALGYAHIVREDALEPNRLAAAVGAALAAGKPASAPLDLSGAERSVTLIEAAVLEKKLERAAWDRLKAVLDRCADEGRFVRFWWRDDDAIEPGLALDGLLSTSGRFQIPLSIAVIPELATADLAQRLADEPLVDVLVHGISHRNNAPKEAKKQELVSGDDTTLEALMRARKRVKRLFGARALPVLVPPWNRIHPHVVARLREAGFAGLSTYAQTLAFDHTLRIDTHIDPMDWKGGGGLVRAPAHIAALAAMLEQALDGGSPEIGPVGLLTHHLVHDPWVWAFVRELLAFLSAHRAVRFVAARELFGLT